MRIALLDIENHHHKMMEDVLTHGGHESHFLVANEQGLETLAQQNFDMLILQWETQTAAKITYLHRLRQQLGPTIPIMLLAKAGADQSILSGLIAGADDYLLKPVRKEALLTRIHVLLQRAYPAWQAADYIEIGLYNFETRTARLTISGNPVHLTQKEFDLGLLLFKNLGRPLSRAYILESVWAKDGEVSSRTMDTHISRIRNKLQLKPEQGFRLAPVYGYGYKLEKITN